MGKLKRFLSTTAVYLAGSVLSKLVSFFLLPLYTSKISPDQYGVYDLVITVISLAAPVAFVQIWDGMFRVSFDYSKEKDKYKIISNAFAVFTAGAVFYAVGFAILQSIFHMEHSTYIFAYGLALSVDYLYGYICRVFLDNKLYMGAGLINTLLTATINIILIVQFRWDVRSLYLSPIIGMLVQSLIIDVRYKVLKRFRFAYIDRNEILKMIRFSIPLCLATASYWLLTGFSKLLITNTLGAADNGVFAIANRFSSMVTLVLTIFQYAWNELAYLMSNDAGRTDTYNLCIDLLLKFVILGSAGVCVFVKILFPYIIHEQYAMAINIIPATIIGSMMNAMASFVGTLFMTEKKNNDIMYSTLIAAGVNIGFGIFGTKLWGLQGATLALMIAFMTLMLIRLWQAGKQFSIKYNWKGITVPICLLVLSILEYYLIDNVILDICVMLGILFAFVFSLRNYISMMLDSMRHKNESK